MKFDDICDVQCVDFVQYVKIILVCK